MEENNSPSNPSLNAGEKLGLKGEIGRLQKNHDEASKNTRVIFYFFLGALAYCFLTIVGTSDRQLLLGEKTQLPIINIQVSLHGFFLLAPVILILIFAYFQLYLHRIKSLTIELRELGAINRLHIYPWMINIAENPEPGAIGFLQKVVVFIMLWVTLPIVLTIFYVWVLKRHEHFLSIILFWESLCGTATVYFFWWLYQRNALSWRLIFFLSLTLLFFGSHYIMGPFWPHLYRGKFNPDSFDPRNLNLSFQKLIQEENIKYSELPLANLKGVDLRWAKLRSTVLTRVDLRNALLQHANLEKSNLKGAWLDSSNLDSVVLSEGQLDSAKLNYVHLKNADIRGAHLEGAELQYAHLEKSDLFGINLKGADLSYSHLEGANFFAYFHDSITSLSSHLENAKMVGSHLEGANFRNAHLEGADLFEAHIHDAGFEYAHLNSANLEATHIEGGGFMWTDLTCANLEHAQLQGAIISGANLKGISFKAARLDNATIQFSNLENANLTASILAGTKFYGDSLAGASFAFSILYGSFFEAVSLRKTNFYSVKYWPTFKDGALRKTLLDKIDVNPLPKGKIDHLAAECPEYKTRICCGYEIREDYSPENGEKAIDDHKQGGWSQWSRK